jgi:hypothetical protein
MYRFYKTSFVWIEGAALQERIRPYEYEQPYSCIVPTKKEVKWIILYTDIEAPLGMRRMIMISFFLFLFPASRRKLALFGRVGPVLAPPRAERG